MWDEIFNENKIHRNFQGPVFEIFIKFSDTACKWHNTEIT